MPRRNTPASSSGTSPALVVIPARLESTRLPRKALLAESGKPLVQHAWEAARRAREAGRIVVATDSDEIARAVRGFGGEAVLTEARHATGSDRVAEVARFSPEEIVVNLQGDWPDLDPEAIDSLVGALREDRECGIATIAYPLDDRPDLFADASQVKVVCDRNRRALYFSRAPVPYPRNVQSAEGFPLGHAGIYGFRRRTLLEFAALEPTPLERLEGLEQLRALENGMPIRLVIGPYACRGIDTREDYEVFLRRMRARSS